MNGIMLEAQFVRTLLEAQFVRSGQTSGKVGAMKTGQKNGVTDGA